MFAEYTMVSEERFSEFFGFTEHEVDELYQRYQKNNEGNLNISRDGIRMWYNGYHTQSGERLYNPRSVVMALSNNNLGNYWTSSGPYDEIYYYIANNVGEVRDDLALMAAGEAIPMKIREYAATARSLKTKEEIFSAMVVYGFLSYENGKVYIPNNDDLKRTLPIAISGFFGQHQFTQWGYVFALSVLSLIPILIVFVSCQSFFIEGLTAGSVKG